MRSPFMLFQMYMNSKYGIEIEENEVATESMILFHEEIDEELFLQEDLEKLPDPLLLLTMEYVDKNKQEWIFCIAAPEGNSDQWLHGLCIRDGKLVDNHILLDIEEYPS